MTLWPGHCMGPAEAAPKPILTEIPKVKIKRDMKRTMKVKTLSGNYYWFSPDESIITANGIGSMEDFEAGETVTWFFPNDEFHYIVMGEAEVTYSLAGTSHTEQKTMHVEEGDIYLIPVGARVTWKVGHNAPLRHFCIIVPGWPRSEHKAPGSVEILE